MPDPTLDPTFSPIYAGGPAQSQDIFLQNLPASMSFMAKGSFQESLDVAPLEWTKRYLDKLGVGQDEQAQRFTADEARERLKQETVTFDIPDTGMSATEYQSMVDREYAKRAHADAIARGPSGFAAGTVRFGAGLLAQAFDPINLAAGFIPVVGQARLARMLEQAGTSALARAGVYARVGMVEGAVGTAALEPGMHFLASQLQEDYTMADSLLNVGFGTILGGGLHAGVGALRDWKRSPAAAIPSTAREVPPIGEIPQRIAALTPEAREDLGRIALAQAIDGRDIDIAASLDYHEIKQRAIDEERQPGFLQTAEDLLALRQEERLRDTPGFLQTGVQKLMLREMDAQEQAIQTRIDEKVQGGTERAIAQIEEAQARELAQQIERATPNENAGRLAHLMEMQQARAALLESVPDLKREAAARDLTVKELKEKVTRMQRAGERDLEVYRKAGLDSTKFQRIMASQRQAEQRVQTAIEQGARQGDATVGDTADRLLKEQPSVEAEQASGDVAELRQELQAHLGELEAILKAEQSSRAITFTTEKGSTYRVEHGGKTTRNKAARPEHPGDFGPKPKSERTFYVTREAMLSLSEIQSIGYGKRAIVALPNGTVGIRYLDGPDAGKIERRTVTSVSEIPSVGLYPVELWYGGTSQHFGNKITQVDGAIDLTDIFKSEDAAIAQAKDEGKILNALASCRLRND